MEAYRTIAFRLVDTAKPASEADKAKLMAMAGHLREARLPNTAQAQIDLGKDE